jgi:hypothetical protein
MAQSIGNRIESIKAKYDREIGRLTSQRDREIVQALNDGGISLQASAGRAPQAAAAPAPRTGKKRGRKKKKTTAATAPQAAAKSPRGKAKRLTKQRKEALAEKALKLFSSKPGKRFSRRDLVAHLNVKPTQVSTVLGGIDGIKREGTKATSVYYI